ncbi:TonB-dependent receptor [Pseudoalteromonas luteoviolacea]|uniref:TonB-dependent receptor n=1 Tax=Pseudoalteromonas luteoviolacea (strain 2ta16) TaxID=1353533 RepID=V4HU48_PSEL2|nr:TonB-dependent receptor [Pseudoalteromonas luteoviolacea]ESP94320.1 TonB-dependent receptor [Pseudoalteromonas luteoviolacea 2ta16]KZN36138.1 TonB-denpendent receptor [Pseudoalteromonas luteoviolacea NCIMB 1944]
MKHNLSPFKRSRVSFAVMAAVLSVGAYAEDAGVQAEQVEVIEVRGIRASTERSLNTKRFADGVVDSITAEDIGKLPDITIADSLQRVPGIQIRRSAGEGSTINVRGMPQVTTLLNGEQFLSAGSITKVQPDFTDIPSSLVGSMNVMKSPTADTLAGGISGTVDLLTRKPFDLEEGFSGAALAEASTGSYSEETDPKFMVSAGYNGDRFAVLATLSYDEANLANYRYGSTDDGWAYAPFENHEEVSCWFCPKQDMNGDGDSDDAEFTYVSYGIMNRFTERERLGATVSFQAQLSDNWTFSSDVFYTDMDDADRHKGITADNAWGGHWHWQDQHDPINRGVLDNGHNLYTAQDITLNSPRVVSHSESHTNQRESTNFNFELEFKGDGNFSGKARFITADAERSHTENVAQGYLTNGLAHGLRRNDGTGPIAVNPGGYGPNPIPMRLNFKGKHPSLTGPSELQGEVFGSNINRYAIVSTYSENNYDEEASLDVLRLDGEYQFDYKHLEKMSFGVRVGQRDVTRDQFVLLAPFSNPVGEGSVNVMWKDQGLAAFDTNGDGEVSVVDGDITMGANTPFNFTGLPEGWVEKNSDFGPVNLGEYYFVDPRQLDDPFAFQNALYPGNIRGGVPGSSYKIEEQTQSVYWRADLSNDFYRANVGFQYIETDLDIVQNEVGDSICTNCPGEVAKDVGDIVTARSYSDFLPSVNVAFNLRDDVILRTSWGKTMTRLDLKSLGGGLTISRARAGDELAASEGISPDLLIATNATMQGNPDLEPWRAENTDVTLEWYFSPSALVSVALFNIDLESFIESAQWQIAAEDGDGVVRRNVTVNGQINGQGGTMEGAEFSYQQAFDFLPGFWSGFGAAFNYTYSESESGKEGFGGEPLPLEDNSKESGNAVLWYEQYGFQFRLAANYRSKRLHTVSTPGGMGNIGVWTEPTTYIDMSASYDINDNLTVYMSGSNLTEEYESQYAQWQDNRMAQNIYERRFTLGVRGRW